MMSPPSVVPSTQVTDKETNSKKAEIENDS